MPNVYDAGDLVRLTATFVASGGAIVTPASVYLLVKPPGGPVTTYGYPANIGSAATGCFYLDQLASQTGDWVYRYVGQPSVGLAAGEGTFHVRPSAFVL